MAAYAVLSEVQLISLLVVITTQPSQEQFVSQAHFISIAACVATPYSVLCMLGLILIHLRLKLASFALTR